MIDPSLIEAFFDHPVKTTSPVTAKNRISRIKKYLECVERMVPGWESPFRYMDMKLKKKLGKTRDTEKRKALTATETKHLYGTSKSRKILAPYRSLLLSNCLSVADYGRVRPVG